MKVNKNGFIGGIVLRIIMLVGITYWACRIPSDYLYRNYPVEIATKLHQIELDYIVNGEVTDSRLEWAKANISNIKEPLVYFQPCRRWLEENGIKFREE